MTEEKTDIGLKALELTEIQETELRRIFGYYQKETERCRRAKAYLAGCVMAGAELETALILMITAYPDDAMATNKLPRQKKAVKPLLDWNLAELLRVAKAAEWVTFWYRIWQRRLERKKSENRRLCHCR